MKRFHSLLIASAISLAACAAPSGKEPLMKRITPLLTVESIEPSLDFWVERLGFHVTAEVPEGDALGFVILERDGHELMLQTRSSVAADNPSLAAELSGGATCLYMEVAQLEPLIERLAGVPVLVPKHDTFYGATEIYVREPGGHVIGLAQMQEATQ